MFEHTRKQPGWLLRMWLTLQPADDKHDPKAVAVETHTTVLEA